MRYALISDIHGNLEALEAVLEDIGTQRIDRTVCLGDVVGYGADPDKCTDRVRDNCRPTILGNHDAAAMGMLSTHNFNVHAKIAIEWTAEHLGENTRLFLHSLPLRETRDDLSLVHATPYEPNTWHYITSLEEAAFNFQFFDTSFCFVGHTHIPLIIVVNGKRELYVHQDDHIDYRGMENARFLINVGSVGQPRDRDARACYGILDTEARYFNYRRVDYDIALCRNKMRSIEMPEFLIDRLAQGR